MHITRRVQTSCLNWRCQISITTVADLVERLQKMPQDLPVVDMGRIPFEDVFEDIKYYDDGREEKVVVVY